MRGHSLASNACKEVWANYVPLDSPSASVDDGGNSYGVPYFGQCRVWAPGLEGFIWDQGEKGEAFTCPAVYSQSAVTTEGARLYDIVPFRAAWESYYYSAAMISSKALWSPENTSGRASPDLFRARVGVHQVLFPSSKIVMSEIADHHGTGANCYDASGVVLNVAAADGHATTVNTSSAATALVWRQPSFGFVQGYPIPFSSAVNGFAGRDF